MRPRTPFESRRESEECAACSRASGRPGLLTPPSSLPNSTQEPGHARTPVQNLMAGVSVSCASPCPLLSPAPSSSPLLPCSYSSAPAVLRLPCTCLLPFFPLRVCSVVRHQSNLHVYIVFRTAGSLVASVHLDFFQSPRRRQLELIGTDGVLSL